MKTILYILAIILTVTFFGCKDNFFHPDITPPSPPQGLSTATGDNVVELFWNSNVEHDLKGYNVFVSSAYDGEYALIGTTRQTYFVDNGARNGHTYYYAVSAFDYDGNESELSKDVAYDTPRPEGYDVPLKDYRTVPELAGYDFSTYSVGVYNDRYTDVYFENYNGQYYLDVWDDSDIQDVGYTSSIAEIPYAPVSGWSPTKDVRVIVGHTYVVWTWDNHFAKLRVRSVSPSRITFDWAYQLQEGNTRLKRSVPEDRGALTPGSGATERR